MIEAGWSVEVLKVAGYEAHELREAKCSALDLKVVGFSLSELRTAGYSTQELQDIGYGAEELRTAGVSLNEFAMAGASVAELKAAGPRHWPEGRRHATKEPKLQAIRSTSSKWRAIRLLSCSRWALGPES